MAKCPFNKYKGCQESDSRYCYCTLPCDVYIKRWYLTIFNIKILVVSKFLRTFANVIKNNGINQLKK